MRIINDGITSANRRGDDQFVYNLPTTVDIADLTHKTSQILLYGGLIKKLETGGFTVRILLELNAPKLIITWVNPETEELKTYRKLILNREMKRS
ncbi:MAG: hypothetical protein KAS12_01485 [Candidatus Aenigmarchaeota archaeon]|nr:hypothetical protein [Candidatus Aenigmarchaeota archaeon]